MTQHPVPRDQWREAIWNSDLPAVRRMCALVFARFAAEDGRDVWVLTTIGMQRAGVSKRTWERAVGELVTAGWLRRTRAARTGPEAGDSSAAHYALTAPTGVDVRLTRTPRSSRQPDANPDRSLRHSDQSLRHSGDLRGDEGKKQQQRPDFISEIFDGSHRTALAFVTATFGDKDSPLAYARSIPVDELRPYAEVWRLKREKAKRRPRTTWDRAIEVGSPEWQQMRGEDPRVTETFR